MIAGTAMAWCEAITAGKDYDERLDAPRFRAAFVKLAAIRRIWPVPADFLEALPPRDQLALTRQSVKADPARAQRAIADIARTLRMDGKTAAAGPDA